MEVNAFALAAIAIALASSGPQAVAHPEACTLADLRWMAANWLNEQDPTRAQETWVEAPEGVLMGSSFEFPKGQKGYAEIMTVRADDGVPTMVLRHFDAGLSKAWEERTAPMVFRAAACDGASATFDGQGDHLGEHMTYSRNGDHLLIIADFLHSAGSPSM